ncbi:MAG: 4Fe-4S binding protein [archaeon]
MTVKRIQLTFPPDKVKTPLTYHFTKDYNLKTNIFRAKITPDEMGELGLELEGSDEDISRALKFAESQGVTTEPLSKSLVWDKDICIHCTACRSVCPSEAISVKNHIVDFDNEKCVVCGTCVDACPMNAIRVIF